jgi:hypothetical protein
MLGAVLSIGAAATAEAGQKPGQWIVTTRMFMKGLPAEQVAMMKQMGMAGMLTGEPQTSKQCVTPEEAAKGLNFDMGANNTCQLANKVVTDTKMSADMICPGPDIKGKGHMQVALTGDSAFAGTWTVDGVDQDGQPMQQEIQFSGQWAKATCDADAKK